MAETDVGLQVVFKIASRCNLNCSYCYVYNKGDNSWRNRPALMSDTVFRAGIERTRRHCLSSGQKSVCLTFHGGEPCLAGARRFADWCAYARLSLEDIVHVQLCLQTNGTLLDDEWADVLAHHGVNAGISMDGAQAVHDKFRVNHDGRGSYEDVVRGIRRLKAAGIPVQILSVVQFGADGPSIHRHFVNLGANVINYLFPDFNHDTIQRVREIYGPTPCADYLIPIFDEWWHRGAMDVRVNLFWNIARVILGGESDVDFLGNQPLRFVFIETAGEIEALDVLRACRPGLPGSGLDVMHDDFARIADASAFHREVIFTGMPLPGACRNCVERATCGGGYLPHRYSRENGFDNPSVWCADLLRLFGHIRRRLGVGLEETRLRRGVLREMATQVAFEAATAPAAKV